MSKTAPRTKTCERCQTVFATNPSSQRPGRGRFCSLLCANRGRGTKQSEAERFWAKVSKGDGADTCWEWRGSKMGEHSYGFFGHSEGRTVRAHRRAYELSFGIIPVGLNVLHRCDNPPCCNPSHLFLGTQADNIADMIAKGRQAWRSGNAR